MSCQRTPLHFRLRAAYSTPMIESTPMTEQPFFPPPRRVLWEITAHCNLRCAHCLVDAGGGNAARELSTDEALALVDDLAELGPTAVSLTGGEPLLRKDWFQIAEKIRARGMGLRMSSNGHLLTESMVESLKALKLELFTLSIEGDEVIHNRLRPYALGNATKNSFQDVLQAIRLLNRHGIETHVITSVSQENLGELPRIHQLLKQFDIARWILQLVHPTGRAAHSTPSRRHMENACTPILPQQLPAVADFIVTHADDPVLQPTAFNSIGYLSRQEPVLRKSGKRARKPLWQGCQCGIEVMGIEPDGGIKGCANQVGAPFVVGNAREESVVHIWNDRRRWHWLSPRPADAGGDCAECALFHLCRAGCTAVAWKSTGQLFNNPYCLRRVAAADSDAPH